MAGTTTKGLRYPSAGDNPAVHTDIQNLATDVDSELDNYILAASPIFTANIEVPTAIIFEGSTADGNETTFQVTNPTADRTITLPDVSGTVVTTGNLTAITTLTSPTISNATFTGQQSGLQVAFNDVLVFEGTTADAYELTLSAGEPTADRVVTLPDTTDTLATLTDVNTAIAEAKMNLLMLGGM